MPKYLLIYEKGESVRWLGHLDILRTVERAIRRAGLPIAFSNGFNPRERIAFANALGTGITGAAEHATLELTELLSVETLQQNLNDALPPGLRIHGCREITEAESKEFMAAYDRAEYEVVCDFSPDTLPEAAKAAVQNLLARSEVVLTREREKKSKIVNIRPNLYALAVCSFNEAALRLTLRMIVGQGESGTAKPGEVVTALAEEIPGLTLRRAHRVRPVHGREPIES